LPISSWFSATGNPSDVRRVWATALAIAWLRRNASEFEDEWGMLARKARTWLDDVDVRLKRTTSWMDAAVSALSEDQILEFVIRYS
jgi:hypothetical protein